MSAILDENSNIFKVPAFVFIFIALLGIGKAWLLPQISLALLGTILIIQQVSYYKIGRLSKAKFAFNLLVCLGFVAWFAEGFFMHFVWLPHGTEMADVLHPIKINSHGKIRYITHQQNQIGLLLKGLGFIAIVTSLFSKKLSNKQVAQYE